jgi:hypothetical protein
LYNPQPQPCTDYPSLILGLALIHAEYFSRYNAEREYKFRRFVYPYSKSILQIAERYGGRKFSLGSYQGIIRTTYGTVAAVMLSLAIGKGDNPKREL